MSPFLVYLMFQADGVATLFGILSFVLAAAGFVLICAANQSVCSWDNRDDVLAQKAMCAKHAKWTLPSAVLAFSIACLMPSTKTIAAMVVLPKLTSPQALDAMGSEARDLYKLAKQALSSIAGDDKHKSDTPQH